MEEFLGGLEGFVLILPFRFDHDVRVELLESGPLSVLVQVYALNACLSQLDLFFPVPAKDLSLRRRSLLMLLRPLGVTV